MSRIGVSPARSGSGRRAEHRARWNQCRQRVGAHPGLETPETHASEPAPRAPACPRGGAESCIARWLAEGACTPRRPDWSRTETPNSASSCCVPMASRAVSRRGCYSRGRSRQDRPSRRAAGSAPRDQSPRGLDAVGHSIRARRCTSRTWPEPRLDRGPAGARQWYDETLARALGTGRAEAVVVHGRSTVVIRCYRGPPWAAPHRATARGRGCAGSDCGRRRSRPARA